MNACPTNRAAFRLKMEFFPGRHLHPGVPNRCKMTVTFFQNASEKKAAANGPKIH